MEEQEANNFRYFILFCVKNYGEIFERRPYPVSRKARPAAGKVASEAQGLLTVQGLIQLYYIVSLMSDQLKPYV